MKEIKTEDAIGSVLCHDITEIVKDQRKGPRFKKGHIIKEEDNLKKYIYDSTYNLEDIHIEVSVDTKDITSINYNYLNVTYSLLYSNIRD